MPAVPARTGKVGHFVMLEPGVGGEPAQPGDRIGILLELVEDSRSLTIYRNGLCMGAVRLGSDYHEVGYCWAVAMPTHVTVRIESAPCPTEAAGPAVPLRD